MTPEQKVENTIATVREARRWYKREEFVSMVNIVWDAVELSEKTAVEASTPVDAFAPGGTGLMRDDVIVNGAAVETSVPR